MTTGQQRNGKASTSMIRRTVRAADAPKSPETGLRAAASSSNPGGSRHRSLSDLVYDKVLADIVDGILAINARLPAEGALAEKFSVSRPVVREALARLRDDGLIVSRQGSGSYVTGQPAQAVRALAPLSSISDMQRCFEFRVGVEGYAARQAALRRSDADLDRLRLSIELLDEVVRTNALGVNEDYEFHFAVSQASHNRFYVGTLEFLHDNIVSGMTLTRNLSLRRSSERLKVVQVEHYEIFTAIANRDGEAACQAMQRHLENARRRVFEGVDEDQVPA